MSGSNGNGTSKTAGLWISAEILALHALKPSYRLVLAEVHQMQERFSRCNHTPARFARRLGMTPRQIQNILEDLKAKKLLSEKNGELIVNTNQLKSYQERVVKKRSTRKLFPPNTEKVSASTRKSFPPNTEKVSETDGKNFRENGKNFRPYNDKLPFITQSNYPGSDPRARTRTRESDGKTGDTQSIENLALKFATIRAKSMDASEVGEGWVKSFRTIIEKVVAQEKVSLGKIAVVLDWLDRLPLNLLKHECGYGICNLSIARSPFAAQFASLYSRATATPKREEKPSLTNNVGQAMVPESRRLTPEEIRRNMEASKDLGF